MSTGWIIPSSVPNTSARAQTRHCEVGQSGQGCEHHARELKRSRVHTAERFDQRADTASRITFVHFAVSASTYFSNTSRAAPARLDPGSGELLLHFRFAQNPVCVGIDAREQ